MSTPESPLPLVTVITVTYNLLKAGREESFHQCMASVHEQTYGAVEHLLIDGASTDGTLEVLREYEARGWARVLSEPDAGLYDAMNKGIFMARGKYVAFLNSDDYWHEHQGIEVTVARLEEAGADFSYAPWTVVEGKKRSKQVEPCIARFLCEMPFCHQTMFCRTEKLRELGGFDWQRYRVVADCDLVTRLILGCAKSVYVPLNFTSYRAGGVSGNECAYRQEMVALHRRHYARFIGEEEAARLGTGMLPVSLYTALASMLSPEILVQLGGCLQETAHATYRYLAPRCSPRTRWCGPLGIPLMARLSSGASTVWKLFYCIPLWSVRTREKRWGVRETRCLLLGVLPLWRVQTGLSVTDKHYLFSILPVWIRRRR